MAAYSTPLGKYEQQARQAKQRGIAWELTFSEWMAVWAESGKWDQRGKRAGHYVMARKGDVGPYSRENVYICLASENHSHAHTNGRVPIRPKADKPRKQRIVRGWTLLQNARAKKRYQVMVGATYVGVFATQAEAEAAYAKASQRGVAGADPAGSFSGAVVHGSQFCPGKPLNATQPSCEAL